MSRITSKRQVTIPKAIADRYGIAAGDEIEFLPAGDAIRVQLPEVGAGSLDPDQRLELFDRATKRRQARQESAPKRSRSSRGWRREDLYERGSSR